jgi:hypothetical protein
MRFDNLSELRQALMKTDQFVQFFYDWVRRHKKCVELKGDYVEKTSITVSCVTKIYPPLPTSVQPISITKTLLIVPTKNERGPHLFTRKLLIKFQNIPRNTKYSSYHTT